MKMIPSGEKEEKVQGYSSVADNVDSDEKIVWVRCAEVEKGVRKIHQRQTAPGQTEPHVSAPGLATGGVLGRHSSKISRLKTRVLPCTTHHHSQGADSRTEPLGPRPL